MAGPVAAGDSPPTANWIREGHHGYIDNHRYMAYNRTMSKIEPKAKREARICCPPDDPELARYYPELEGAAALFKALADETRLAILRQLQEREEISACDFVACCRVAQPTVSHHLKVLRKAGLVTAEKRGLWVYYRLNREKLDALRRLLP